MTLLRRIEHWLVFSPYAVLLLGFLPGVISVLLALYGAHLLAEAYDEVGRLEAQIEQMKAVTR